MVSHGGAEGTEARQGHFTCPGFLATDTWDTDLSWAWFLGSGCVLSSQQLDHQWLREDVVHRFLFALNQMICNYLNLQQKLPEGCREPCGPSLRSASSQTLCALCPESRASGSCSPSRWSHSSTGLSLENQPCESPRLSPPPAPWSPAVTTGPGRPWIWLCWSHEETVELYLRNTDSQPGVGSYEEHEWGSDMCLRFVWSGPVLGVHCSQWARKGPIPTDGLRWKNRISNLYRDPSCVLTLMITRGHCA